MFPVYLLSLSFLLSICRPVKTIESVRPSIGAPGHGDDREFAVAGYVPEYRYGRMNWTAAAQSLSHLIIFSLEVSGNGEPTALDRLPPKQTWLNDILPSLAALPPQSRPQLQLCFGGYGRTRAFPIVSTSKVLRRKFVSSTLALLDEYGFDGVDLNWEYPTKESEWKGLVALIKEFLSAFEQTEGEVSPHRLHQSRRVISFALYPGQESIIGALPPSFFTTRSLVHMMTYDAPGSAGHALEIFALETMKSIRAKCAELAASTSIHSEQCTTSFTIGLPFYSRAASGDAKAYFELVEAVGVPSRSTDVVMIKGVSHMFNGVDTLLRKVDFSIDALLGGVMIWEVGQDVMPCAMTDNGALLEAIRAHLAAKTSPDFAPPMDKPKFRSEGTIDASAARAAYIDRMLQYAIDSLKNGDTQRRKGQGRRRRSVENADSEL